MLRTIKKGIRVLAVLALILATAGGAVFAQTGANRTADSAALVNEFPMALVYHGVTLFANQDYEGAINAWEQYLKRNEPGADTVRVQELIREAWIRQYPLSLVYDGYARYVSNDLAGAIDAWERYIDLAPAGEDTAAVRSMIVNVLVPEQDLAKLSVHVTWFVNHDLQEINDVLSSSAVFASAEGHPRRAERPRAAELRTAKQIHALKVAPNR